MNTINCDLCGSIIAYTNRNISKATRKYLNSAILTNNQKWAMMQREKLIYCPKCYEEGMQKAIAEVKRENENI